jgi:hypothetical protein
MDLPDAAFHTRKKVQIFLERQKSIALLYRISNFLLKCPH